MANDNQNKQTGTSEAENRSKEGRHGNKAQSGDMGGGGNRGSVNEDDRNEQEKSQLPGQKNNGEDQDRDRNGSSH